MRSAFSTSTIVCGVVALLLVGLALVSSASSGANPLLVAAGAAFPLLVVAPVLFWFDRSEPEPRWAVGHAFLFGAGIAVTAAAAVSGVVDTVASAAISSRTGLLVGVVVAAPVVEELAKAAGVRRALRQGMLNTAVDGAVYAGWVALGFTVVEDVLYLSQASSEGVFVEVFIIRCVLSPFAHTAFTVLTGLGVGRCRSNGGGRVWPFLAAAIALHAAWNSSAVYADAVDSLWPIVAVYVLVLGVSAGCVITVQILMKNERRVVQRGITHISEHITLSPDDVAALVKPAAWRRHNQAAQSRLRYLREMALTYEAALTCQAAARRYKAAASAIGLGHL